MTTSFSRQNVVSGVNNKRYKNCECMSTMLWAKAYSYLNDRLRLH